MYIFQKMYPSFLSMKIFKLLILILCITAFLPAHDKFVLVTVPKCGSHLIIHMLNEMLQKDDQRQLNTDFDVFLKEFNIAERKGTYLSTHQLCTPEAVDLIRERGYKVIFVIRDPRDQLVSLMYFNQNGYWPHLPMNDFTVEEKITELITGEHFGFYCYEESYARRIGWIDLGPDITYVTTFEKLIGRRGGGSDELQIQELMNIAGHIGVPLNRKKCKMIAKKAFGKDYTFRKGQIGSWKSHFTEENKALYKQYYGQELIGLGYETDFNW